jgi:hypothetical protein
MPDVGSLSVCNTKWQMPRVKQEHFPVEDFAIVVQQACSLRPCGEISHISVSQESLNQRHVLGDGS